ncbi:MAG: hypothetical protein QNJ64_11855 [Crocosphaera sp.]|nr:hypothetical protein [Crocosphaera sp.]
MIKIRIRNLAVFLMTIGFILIFNSTTSLSQNSDLICKERDNCVVLGDQELFEIYPDSNNLENQKNQQRVQNINQIIDSIANNLLIDTNTIFISNTCLIDENRQQSCEAILSYTQSNNSNEKPKKIISINQSDVTETNNNQQSDIELPIDLANKYKKIIQTQINVYRGNLRDTKGNPWLTSILLAVCFILMFHQLFLNQLFDFIQDLIDLFSGIYNQIFSTNKNSINQNQDTIYNEENDYPQRKKIQKIQEEFKVGLKRTYSENTIEEIYCLYPDYVIFRTKNTIKCYINEEHLALEDEKPLSDRYNEVQSKLSKIASKQPTKIEPTETINIVVYHGLKLALDGKKEEAEEVFDLANERMDKFRKKYNTLQYLNGSFTVVLCFLSAMLLLTILPELFPDSFQNVFTVLGISEEFIPVIIFGSLGGFLSVSYRIRSAGLDIKDPDSNFRILGASRIYIAVISSIFIYAVLKADIINGTATSLLDVNDTQMSLSRIAFFSAVAGFVEGFIPDILDNSASRIKTDKNSEDE